MARLLILLIWLLLLTLGDNLAKKEVDDADNSPVAPFWDDEEDEGVGEEEVVVVTLGDNLERVDGEADRREKAALSGSAVVALLGARGGRLLLVLRNVFFFVSSSPMTRGGGSPAAAATLLCLLV